MFVERIDAQKIVNQILSNSGLKGLKAKTATFNVTENSWHIKVWKPINQIVRGLVILNAESGKVIRVSDALLGYVKKQGKELILNG